MIIYQKMLFFFCLITWANNCLAEEKIRTITISQFLKGQESMKPINENEYPDDFITNNKYGFISEIALITKDIYTNSYPKLNHPKVKIDTIQLHSVNIVLGNYDDTTYHLEQENKQADCFVISYDGEQEYGYLVINKKTNSTIELKSYPIFSSDGGLCVTATNSGEPDIMVILNIYDLNNDLMTKRQSFKEIDMQIEEIYWQTNHSIYIKAIDSNGLEKYGMLKIDDFHSKNHKGGEP